MILIVPAICSRSQDIDTVVCKCF